MLDHKILPAMVAVSNYSHLTKEMSRLIINKLDEKEKQDFLAWLNLVKDINTI